MTHQLLPVGREIPCQQLLGDVPDLNLEGRQGQECEPGNILGMSLSSAVEQVVPGRRTPLLLSCHHYPIERKLESPQGPLSSRAGLDQGEASFLNLPQGL